MAIKIDLTGKKLGRWEVISLHSTTPTYWNCKCECGTYKKVASYELHTGKSKSCGCLRKELAESKGLSLAPGTKSGHLTIIRELDPVYLPSGQKNKIYECLCDCGDKTKVRHSHLAYKKIISCGCLHGEKHGLSRTRLYPVWKQMVARCHRDYVRDEIKVRYQYRGIKVCKEWRLSFKAFYEWCMKNGYKKGLQIDRIDNNDGYSPENCRWVTARVNGNNKSDTIFYTLNGVRKSRREWSEALGIKSGTISTRVDKLGWDVEKALTTPVNAKYHNRFKN